MTEIRRLPGKKLESPKTKCVFCFYTISRFGSEMGKDEKMEGFARHPCQAHITNAGANEGSETNGMSDK